jgi:hypothetical protein
VARFTRVTGPVYQSVFFIRFSADRANARPAHRKHLILKWLKIAKRANARLA